MKMSKVPDDLRPMVREMSKLRQDLLAILPDETDEPKNLDEHGELFLRQYTSIRMTLLGQVTALSTLLRLVLLYIEE